MGFINIVSEFGGDTTQYWENYDWKSKSFLFDKRVRMSAGRVLFTSTDLDSYYAEVAARNDLLKRNNAKLASGVTGVLPGGGWDFDGAVLGGDALESDPGVPTYSGDDTLTFKVYAGGTLQHTETVISTLPFRLPGGFRDKEWEIELIGNVVVERADIAASVQEIMREEQ